MTQEKLLDKLAAMRRHAESAKAIGSEAEAQAFAEMLHTLLLKHNLSMSDIDFEAREKDSPVELHRIDYSKYEGVKVKKTRVAWIQELADFVARAHFCRILVHTGSSRVTLVGKKEDAAVAEYMFVTLQRAAEKISNRAYETYRNEERKKNIALLGEAGRHGSMPHTFGFRESFVSAFINRLRARFAERMTAASNSTSTALVRVNKSESAVAGFMENLKTKNASALSTSSSHHGEGYRRGRSAADRIDLGGKAIPSTGSMRGRLS